MKPASYQLDPLGGITEIRWCPEEGQWIVKQIGSVYEYNQSELLSMGIKLDDRF
jgi:hypothetical protein|tara:strand:+ start:465 stop:626 length:162 start_codon:yes stop_codon:yes gene_type:complete